MKGFHFGDCYPHLIIPKSPNCVWCQARDYEGYLEAYGEDDKNVSYIIFKKDI